MESSNPVASELNLPGVAIMLPHARISGYTYGERSRGTFICISRAHRRNEEQMLTITEIDAADIRV